MIYLILLEFGKNEMYNKFIALGGSLFFSFHAQTSFITNSGMETNLYIFIFILNLFIYIYKINIIYLAIFNIVMLFIRPDSLLIIPIFSLSLFIFRKNSIKDLFLYFIVISFGIILYALMFYKMTGHPIPNTASAKYNYFLYSCMNLK